MSNLIDKNENENDAFTKIDKIYNVNNNSNTNKIYKNAKIIKLVYLINSNKHIKNIRR